MASIVPQVNKESTKYLVVAAVAKLSEGILYYSRSCLAKIHIDSPEAHVRHAHKQQQALTRAIAYIASIVPPVIKEST